MRARPLAAVAAMLLLLAAPATRADAPDPIDAALDACLAKPAGESTQGMVECMQAALEAWDRRLNEVYQQVMKVLDPKSQELLRASQRRWVAFRDAERAALGGPWREDRGSIVRVETMDVDLSAVRERVKELRLYGGD